MATVNPFDLLGDDDNDDPSHLIQVQQQKIAAKKLTPAAPPPAATAKLPSKPIPPSQAVREAKSITATARGGGGGRGGYGRGGRGSGIGPNRDFGDGNYNGFARGYGGGGGGGGGDGDGGRPPERERNHGAYGFRGGRRGEYGNGGDGVDSDRPSRRVFDRHSGSGHGNDVKREGSGRGNWGTVTDDVLAQETEENVNLDEKVVAPEKQLEQEDGKTDVKANKESQTNEAEEKEQEDKEMTLEEYEKIREDKRKALLSLKTEERKVEVDKEFESMQQLSLKKGNGDIFIKLGSDKDNGKKRENAERDVVKKLVSINDFLKPAEGERYYSPGGRGRGRGRGGDRGSFRGGFGGRGGIVSSAPSIEDPTQFPSLGGK